MFERETHSASLHPGHLCLNGYRPLFYAGVTLQSTRISFKEEEGSRNSSLMGDLKGLGDGILGRFHLFSIIISSKLHIGRAIVLFWQNHGRITTRVDFQAL